MDKSPNRNLRCAVCNANIRFSKKVECAKCKLMTCKDHSVLHENSNHFCENCEKNYIKSQYFSELLEKIQSLQEDLEILEKDAKKLTNETIRKNDFINILEKQFRGSQTGHLEKVELYERKIGQEIKKGQSDRKLIEYLEQSLQESEKSEKTCTEKLNFSSQEVFKITTFNGELLEDQGYLLSTIDGFRSELRGAADVSRLKLLSCANCYKKIKHKYIEYQKLTLHTENYYSFISNISQDVPSEKILIKAQVCKPCNII